MMDGTMNVKYQRYVSVPDVCVSRNEHIRYNAINTERDLVVYRFCLLLFYF
jgi:hypothetical protein